MQSGSQCLPGFRELDRRANDGIDVWLLWRPIDDRVVVAVADSKTGDAFTVEVGSRQRALEVFHHPYAYAGRPGASRSQHRLAACGGARAGGERAWDRY